jgi:hypothetical protein
MMLRLYVECPVHGFRPLPTLIEGTSAEFVTSGSTANCPRCGVRAPIVDARYVFDSEGGVAASPISQASAAQLRRLQTALAAAQRAQSSNADETERVARDLERTIRRDAPAIAPFLDAISGRQAMGVATWLSVLIALIALFISGQPVDENVIEHVVEETIERTRETAPTPTPMPEAPTLEESPPPPAGPRVEQAGYSTQQPPR